MDELYFENVLPLSQGQAPARQAGFAAGLGEDVPATTLNKMCGSGMKATMIGYDQLALGHSNVGRRGHGKHVECAISATQNARRCANWARSGHGPYVFGWIRRAYDKGRLMGTFAEDCAEKYQFTREAQDEYALGSLSNALDAQKSGAFAREIATVTLKTRKVRLSFAKMNNPKTRVPKKFRT